MNEDVSTHSSVVMYVNMLCFRNPRSVVRFPPMAEAAVSTLSILIVKVTKRILSILTLT